ncbi:MAG: sulfatase [Myxococcota bacterium]|nr:sulfatase [Myxococcota bacterium]
MFLRSLLFAALCALGIVVGCGEKTHQETAPPRNLLLITIDTLRADHIGTYGGTPGLSAHIDALAQEGLRFERAYATAPLTGPSHASILTGRYPSEHGVLYNGMRLAKPMLYTPESTPISSHLQAQGYRTGAIVTALPLIRKYGFATGFDSHEMIPAKTPSKTADIGGSSADAVEATRAWLGRQGEEPFFLWLHLYEVHIPYISPPKVHARLGTEPIAIGVPQLNLSRLEEIQNAYRAEVLEMDDSIGTLLATLEELGLRDSTLIALLSDHGEYLGEHEGLFGHSLLKEEVMRIPMVLTGPGVDPGVHTGAVSAVDLAPTILDIMKLPELPGATGRSLANAEPSSELPIYGEWRDIRLHDATEQAQSRDLLVGVWHGHRKLVRSELSSELRAYDLSVQHGGNRDIYAEKPEWLGEMISHLGDLSVAETPVSSEPVPMSVDGIELLRSLGYIE